MKRRSLSIRFDERTRMLIREISRHTGASTSTVIRALVTESLNRIIDKEGNLQIKRNEK